MGDRRSREIGGGGCLETANGGRRLEVLEGDDMWLKVAEGA